MSYGTDQLKKLNAGVAIIAARDENGVGLHGEHDMLYIGNSDKLTEEDHVKLIELGFFMENDSWFMFCSA